MTGPSFRFRLERVRTVRERKEKLAQRELADAIARRSSTVEDLRNAKDRVEHALAQQRHLADAHTTVSAGDLLARQAFLERVEAQQRLRASELVNREAEVARCDAELVTAAGEHEMLERLRERRRGEHNRDAARRELGFLDEVAALRFHRSQA